MKLILLGAPGAGKGSHAKVISGKCNIPQISTGDLVRAEIKNNTPLGKKIKEYSDKGNLVPDSLIIDMLKKRIAEKDCSKGYILDGFPRTINQADELAKITKVDGVVMIDATEKILLQRLTGRRTCKNCGAIFHIINMPPKKEGVCDKCNGELMQRDDEKEEVIKHRLKVYEEQTKPLINYYDKKGLLHKIDGNEPMEKASPKMMELLKTINAR